MKYSKIIEYFVPENTKSDRYYYTKAKDIVNISYILVLAATLFSILYALFGHLTGCLIIVIGGLLAFFVPFVMRGTKSISLGAHSLALIMWYVQFGLAYSSGGVNAPNLMWFATVPVLAATTGGIRAGIGWGVFTGIIVFSFYLLQLNNITFSTGFPPDFNSNGFLLFKSITAFGLVMFIGSFVVFTEYGTVNTFSKMKIAQEKAEDVSTEMNKIAKELELEKKAVERKIEEAISESEEQRKYLAGSISSILDEMEKFAKGNLIVKVTPQKTDDEIAKLFYGFNHAVENIRAMISKVQEAIVSTSNASIQISSSSEEMAAGAKEQSIQSEEIASAIEEMTTNIIESAKNTTKAAEQSRISGAAAKEGGDVVSQTIEGIIKISAVVSKTSDTIKTLGNSSKQIGDIIQVIDDIADQTNLLALNAAIEAARAGGQGRGFAVVADEVRKLAERTTSATKQISSMIKQIQNDTKNAVESIDLGTKEVENGKKLAEQAGASLNEIIMSADTLEGIINQVASASEQQSVSAQQISQAIESISTISKESAAGVEQVAKATNDLNKLTHNLSELISEFNVGQENYVPISKSGNSRYSVRTNGKIIDEN